MSRHGEPLPSRPAPSESAERAPLPADPWTLPALPGTFHETLAAGLAALPLELDATQRAALDGYVRLLLAWTAAINLTAIREPADVAREHLLDSLTAVPLLGGVDAPALRIVDLGSGGGLPGLPLAIALRHAEVLLVESVGKKARFLATAAAGLGLAARVRVAGERAEDLAAPDRDREAHDVVTVRAVAPLPELVELAFPLLRVGGRLVAWKREPGPADVEQGRPPLAAELAAGRNAARALGGDMAMETVTIPGLTDHRLVVLTKTRPTPRRFPRPVAERRRQPL